MRPLEVSSDPLEATTLPLATFVANLVSFGDSHLCPLDANLDGHDDRACCPS